MFCGKCGTNNPDSAAFCKGCGAPLNPAVKLAAKPAVKPASGGAAVKTALTPEKKNKLVGIAAVVVAALLVIFALTSVFGGSGSKGAKTAEDAALKYTNAVFKPDAKTVFTLVHKNMMADYSSKKRKELTKDLNEELEKQRKYIDDEVGEKWKYSCKVKDTEDASEYRLGWLQEEYQSQFQMEVTDAKYVYVTVSITAKDDETSETVEIPVIKVGNAWYLNVYQMNLFG